MSHPPHLRAEMEFELFDSVIEGLSGKHRDARIRRCMFEALDTDDSGAITVREFLHRTSTVSEEFRSRLSPAAARMGGCVCIRALV